MSRKNPPLATRPEFEPMSNGWALDPDNRQDENEILPLEEMNPALFKEGSSAELTKKLRSLAPGDTTSGGQLKNDPDSTAIAHRGVAYRGRPSLIPMSEGDCHWNIATLYEKGKIDTIVIGYGHNFQGWHQHTWGLKDGKVVESSGENSVNDVWFGVPLSNDEALKFCAHTTKNQPGQGMVRTQKGGPHTAGEEEDDRYSLFYVTMQDQRTPMLQPTSMTGTLPEITEWARDSEKNQFTAKYFALYAFPTEGGKVRAWISPNFKESDEGNNVSTAEGIRLEMKNKGDKDSFIPFNEVIKRTASDDSWKAQSSGVVPICSETKRICLAWRSDKVEEGNCWGTLGGAVKKDMSPEESARTELQEETGYSGPIKTHAAFVFKKEDFTYSNFIGVVDEEFAFQPTFGHEWENDSIEWFTLEEIEQDIKDNPKDYHPGIVTLFEESKDLIHGLVEGKAKQAGELRDSEVMRNNPPEEPLTPEDDTVYALCFNGRKLDTIYTTGFNGTAKQIVEWVNNFEKTTYSIYDKHVKALNTSLDWPGNRPEDSDEFPLNFTPDQKELCKRFGTLDAIAIPAEGGLVQEMRWNASTSWRMFPSDTKVTASEGIKIEGMNANFVGKQIHLPKFRLNGSDEEEKYSLLFMELLGVTDGISTGFSGSLEAIKQWLDDFDKTTFNKYINEDTLAHDQEELCNYYAEGLNPAIVPTEGGRIYTGTFSGERSPMTRRQGQYGTWRLEPSSLEVSVSEGIKIDALNSLAVGRILKCPKIRIKIDALNSLAVGRILKCPKIKTTKKASEEPEIYALYFRYYGASAGTLVSSGVNGTSAQIREWLENFERTTNAEYNVWMESMNNGDNDEEYPKNFNEEQRSLIDYYHDYGVIAVPVEGGQVLEGQFQGGRGWDADTQQIVENSSVDWKLNPIDDEYVSTSDGIKLEGMNIFVGRKTKMPTFIRKKASDPREGVENCQECGEHLNGDDVLEVNKKVVCPDCADKFHRKEAILEEAPVFIGGRLMDDHDYLFRGLPITVEKWKGERRHNRILQADYGFIPDTTGRGDGEAVDVYVGDDHHSPHAYVLEQLKEDGSFDEYKVLLGFESLPEAEAVYLAQFDPGWRETRVQAIHEVPVEEFLDVAEDNMDEDPKTAASHREWWPYGRHKFVPQEGSPECKACELPADHLLHTTPPPEKQASFQIEAEANYDEMFAGLNSTIQNALPPVDGKSGVAISLHQDIQDEINWAKATLRKNYRIIWYLRWAKLDLIEQGVNKTYTYFGREKDIDPATLNEKAHNLGQQLNSLLNKEIGRFNAGAQKAGRHAINTTDLGGVMRAYGVHNQLKHFFDMKQVDKIQDYPLDFQTIPEVLDTFQTFEQEYTAQADEDKRWVPPTSDEEGDLQGEVIVKFPNGWVWWDLGTNYDENEAKSMGHCATCGENATLVSLREPRDNKDGTRSWRPHLTFELDEDGSLRQMKGVANSKPKPEYHSYILALLTATKQVSSKSKKTEPIVKSIKGSSYKREADFALKDLTPEDLETLYAARPDLMPIDIYVQKHGVTRDLMVRVEGELKGVGYKSKWNGSKKSPLFEIEAWENLEDLIGDKGNDLAQWAWKITTNGEEFLDSSNYFNIDTTAKELWDNLPDEMKENVKQILDHKYPQEFKKFLADAQAEAATRRGRIPRENVIDFAEERDEEDLLQAIRNAAQVGEETGTQNEIFKSLKKALEDSAFVPKDPDNYYDGPWVENLTLSEAADLINDTGQNSRMDGGDGDLDHRIVMKEPNYGFADFDEKAAVEYFSNEYGIEKKLKDIEPAKVASTKIIEDYETPRLKVQVTGSPQRLFFEGTLKPEAHDWLTKVNFTDKVVVNFTVDLGADGEAYLNRLDSDIRYRGFGPELMKSALGKIAEMGYKHAKTYIENDNYASQAMVKKLGGTEVPDSYNGQGSYYEFNMGGSHKEAVAVSETGQRYMALSGDKIVEEATIGEYELMVVKSGMIPNIYQVGLQRIGMDAFDPMQQLTKTPNSRGKGSLAEVKRVLNHWLQKYGELVIASHNPDKTPLYVAMVKRLGFKVDNLNLMGWRIPCISKTAAEESEKYSLFTASFETVRKKEELNSSTMLRPIGKIGTL